MQACARPRVKVCCIMSADEARLAVSAGADALGLVADMPSGPGVIPDHLIAAIARSVPPAVATFLLTSRRSAPEIIRHQRAGATNAVQLVDRLTHGSYVDIREALPGIKLVQVIHVTGRDAVDEALTVAPDVDALLLDSGNPALAIKELGGTGRRHDWTISREIRERAPVPVFLAGGLTPANAPEAIAAVGAFGLDLCSGVRTDGRLDPAKLAAFMRAVGRPVPDAEVGQG